MSEIVERQRWLAVLALALAVPLPLTGIVSLPFLAPLAAVAAGVALARRPVGPLPGWVENLLAPAILVAVVAAGGLQYGILRPVAQLGAAVTTVRLPGCGDRRRARTAGGMLALVGLAGIASSTHVALVGYLVALLALVVGVVGRLTVLRLAGGRVAQRAVGWPPARMVAGTVAIAVIVAAPLFVLLPRLRSPFAAAPFGSRPVSGFRDAVALHRIGDVKLSSSVALRVRFADSASPSEDWLRLAGATLQRYRNGVWAQAQMHRTRVAAGPDGVATLAPTPPGRRLQWAEITLEKGSDALFAPLGTVAVTPPEGVRVERSPMGELRIPPRTETPLAYRVGFVANEVVTPPPTAEDLRAGTVDPRVRELALEMARDARTPVAAALAIERSLRENYAYTTSTYAPLREDPVAWFLFRARAGHCEFFASSMVVLLRSLGVPARLQAGFAGGDVGEDGEFVVRDSNAHAWVVAWLPSTWEDVRVLGESSPDGTPPAVRGVWRMFDPTPAEGRPGVGTAGARLGLGLSWQRIEALWDRWVLTFSLADQLEMVRSALVAARDAGLALLAAALVAGAIVFTALAVRRALRRRGTGRQPSSAAGASLARVMAAARRRGVQLAPGTTPRELARRLVEAEPEIGDAVAWLVSGHERSVYAGREGPPAAALRRVERLIRRGLTSSARRAA